MTKEFSARPDASAGRAKLRRPARRRKSEAERVAHQPASSEARPVQFSGPITPEFLQSILNGIKGNVYVSDPETDEILFINESTFKAYGIEGDLRGRKCWEIFKTGFSQRCPHCPIPHLERNPTGSVIWEEYNAYNQTYYNNTDTMIDWGGKLVHLQHSIDITANKQAEEYLQRRLEQQELMFNMSQSFITPLNAATLINNALDMVGVFAKMSKVLLARYNSADQTLDAAYEWYADNQEITRPKNARLPFRKGTLEYDGFITNKLPYLAYSDIEGVKGFEIAFSHGIKALIGVPVFVNGSFWGMLSFNECSGIRQWSESDIQLVRLVSNVIAGVLARSAMEDDLLRMSAIVNSSPQYISYIDTDGAFQYFNQGALSLLGYSAEELAGANIGKIFDKEVLDTLVMQNVQRVLAGEKCEFEAPVIRKDGQRRILLFSTFSVDSESVGIGAIASDITEKRQLETDLISAKEQAEQSSRAKGDFLSRMSHEMRTPLNAIIGMTSIGKKSPELERKEYCLTKIEEASTHLLGVINDILDMSKIEANKFELSNTEFNFERMLMRVVNVVNYRIESKKQELKISLDSNLPAFIIGDDQRITQVIANLLSNAVKFTPEGGCITLSVSPAPAEPAQPENDSGTGGGEYALLVRVSDTGIGISQEQQKRLFQSFEQADGSVSRKFGGTGLGLAISKSIVELMGGRIWVESEEGHGATFSFTVKVGLGQKDRHNLLSPDVNWSNLRLLAVDDAPDVREYFLDFAASVGAYCEVAASAEEACAILRNNLRHPFNIVFVDWKMPGMDGIELTRQIKRQLGGKIVIFMISSAEWSEIEKEAKAAGVDVFIPKPLFASMIVDCINDCLGARRSYRPDTADVLEGGDFAGRRILLAEDVEINREIVLSLLEDSGLVIDCAENGREALRMFEEDPERYDMILMDIHMPEVDGYEATRSIRALDLPRAAAIPIVAMTANVFREDVEKCLAAGMDDHIGKPLNVQELYAKIKKFLPRGHC